MTFVASQPFAKIYAARCDVEIRGFIPVFHTWVKEQRTDGLLIDVHDYSHVHEGPGVILVGHEAHYGMDRRQGRLGLVFRARRTPPEPLEPALTRALSAALTACQTLEADLAGRLAFGTDELLVGFEDRLHAPNDEATWTRLAPDLTTLAKRLLGEGATASRAGEDRDVLSVRLKGSGAALADLRAIVDSK
jgi:hypothetical protein